VWRTGRGLILVGRLIQALLFFFVFDVPKHDVIYCDVIEENHMYDKKGEYTFTQIIFWIEHPVEGLNRSKMHPYGFRMLDRGREIEKSSGYYSYYTKGETYQEGPIEVRATRYKESWTHIDPEATERRSLWKDRTPDLILDHINLRRKKPVEPEPENLEGIINFHP
jgi:hypothetical protein